MKPKSALLHLGYQILDAAKTQALALETLDGITRQAYKGSRDSKEFHKVVELHQSQLLEVSKIDHALKVLKELLSAKTFHQTGEAYFFKEDFSESETNFKKSEKILETAIKQLGGIIAKSDLDYLKAYKIFYTIEKLEAQAFNYRKSGDYGKAIDVHNAEIQLTQYAHKENLGVDKYLTDFFIGHVFFAKSSRLRCLAEIAFSNGDNSEAEKLNCEAARLEKSSEEKNSIWADE